MKEIRYETSINAPADDVYHALTSREGLECWWTSQIDGTPQQEEEVTFRFMDGKYWMTFRVIDMQADKHFEWECVSADEQSAEWIGTRIVGDLSPEDGSTKLIFCHTGWADDAKVFDTCEQTWGQLMGSLKDYVETGGGSPIS